MKKLLFVLLLLIAGTAFYLYDRTAGYREARLCLVVTSDLGTGDRTQNMARALTAIREASRSCEGRTVVVDAGGLIGGDTAEWIVRSDPGLALPEAAFLAAAGYRSVNLSPDYFRLGAWRVVQMMQQSGVSAMTVNITGGAPQRIETDGISLILFGLSLSHDITTMPPGIFEGMTFHQPFGSSPPALKEISGDLAALLLHSDRSSYADRQGAEPTDLLSSIHAQFPFLRLIFSDIPFPSLLSSDRSIGPRLISSSPGRPTLSVTDIRIIKHDERSTGIIADINTHPIDIGRTPPDPQMLAILSSFREKVSAAAGQTAGTTLTGIDLSRSRIGDNSTVRLFHETLLAIAADAGHRPDISIALCPVADFSKRPGSTVTLADIARMVPRDRFPVLVKISGSRLDDLLSAAAEVYPREGASIFPLTYRIGGDGALLFTDRRFSPDHRYLAVVDGRIADLLLNTEDEEVSFETVLPETLATRFARAFPSRLSSPFAPLWKRE